MYRLENDRSEMVFEDYKSAYDANQATVEANRCLFCEDAPCVQACPTGIDIPMFIRKIASGNIKGSARTIFKSNIFGMSCARVCPVEVLCVGDCVFNHMDQPPIQIGKLQRYATDIALQQNWRYFQAGADSGRSVGLVGAGPASIAAAHELRQAGHAVTIYDKREVLGGLNTWGVAPYKLRVDDALAEIDWVMGIGGIELALGVEIGADLSWDELESRHDAIFLGFGLGADRALSVPGADLTGIFGAVDFIERMKLGRVDLSGVRTAAVIGGGNTALDAVRELKGLDVPQVHMIYRGDEAGMSGYAHEWKAGKLEGVRGAWRRQPVGYVGEGKVEAVECDVLSEDKRPTGDRDTIPADLVLLAVGQSKLGEILAGIEGLTVEWGRVVTGEAGATGRAGWYAGGDCANGGKEVVNAVAEGRDAARAINAYLANGG